MFRRTEVSSKQKKFAEIIRHENDPEVLEGYFSIFKKVLKEKDLKYRSFVEDLNEATGDEELIKKLLEKNGINVDFSGKYKDLEEQLCLWKQRYFGKSSEKAKFSDRYRENREKKLTQQAESLAPAPKELEKANLKTIEEGPLEMSEKELSEVAVSKDCPKDSLWRKLFIDTVTVVHAQEVRYVKKTYKVWKYILVASEGTDREIIVSAKPPSKIVKGSKYSPEFAVSVVSDKYIRHLPLERIRRGMQEYGLKVTCRTLYSLCHFVSGYLESVYVRIKEEINKCGLVNHLDETRWPILNSEERDGYFWVVTNQAGSYYHFSESRRGLVAKELIGSDYQGPVLTDGYQGYNWLKGEEGITVCHCWSHARRKFKELERNYPKCEEILKLMQKLFLLEKQVESLEELRQIRKTKSSKVVEKIHKWLLENEGEARRGSALEKAIQYSLKYWEGLTEFLEDERVPLTNNDAERAIRHAVMGRKNFYCSRTIMGAQVASVLYTIIESCKKVELNPREYMLMAVKEKIAGREPKTPLEYAKYIRSDEYVQEESPANH